LNDSAFEDFSSFFGEESASLTGFFMLRLKFADSVVSLPFFTVLNFFFSWPICEERDITSFGNFNFWDLVKLFLIG